MYAATIDRHALNGLFDNQKKLDDLFDSIFDDDCFIISASSSQPYTVPKATQTFTPKPTPVRDSLLRVKEQTPYAFMVPVVLEIAAIYFVVAHLL